MEPGKETTVGQMNGPQVTVKICWYMISLLTDLKSSGPLFLLTWMTLNANPNTQVIHITKEKRLNYLNEYGYHYQSFSTQLRILKELKLVDGGYGRYIISAKIPIKTIQEYYTKATNKPKQDFNFDLT